MRRLRGRLPVPLACVGVLGLAAALVACSGDSSDDSTDAATASAQQFVDAVTATAPDDVDLAEVPLDGTDEEDGGDVDPEKVTRAYRSVVEGLGGLEPEVELGSVDVGAEGTTARATLTWTWPTEPEAWTYESSLLLREPESDAESGAEWSVAWEPAAVHPDLDARDVLDATTVTARRGDVLGAGGARLVRPRPVVEVGIDRAQLGGDDQAAAAARQLAAVVDVDAAPYAEAVAAAGDLAFVPAITLRMADLTPETQDAVEDVTGGRLVGGTLPLAPTAEFAAPILGRVGDVTAEMVEDDPDAYQPGDQAGVSGLQLRYDDQLRGVDGVVVDAVARGGQGETTELFSVEPEAGDDLALTLDEGLQLEAERLLADVAPTSALVALRPSTGEVLAAANGPGNDGQNLATFGQFAPGSTFKVVSTLALLRSGLTPSSTVPCTPTVTVDGKQFENYDGYPADDLGDVTLRTAIANSCNTAVISQRDRLGDDDLGTAAADLGVGVDHDVGFPAFFGSLEPPASQTAAAADLGLGVDHDVGFPAFFGSLEPPASQTAAAADLIGQGTVLASPMAMATVIASVQEGATVVPALLADADPVAPGGADPSAEEASALREVLGAVVTEGSGSLLADVPGPPVIAKTGTAEFDDGGTIRLHAWMVAAQGDLAVAVFVGEGDSGSATAGPILEAFLRAAG